MKMQRICIDLTRLYSQSAKCAYSSVPLTSSVNNTLGTSIGFIDSIGLSKIKCSVKNIRCIASNTMPSLNNIKNWYTVKFIKTNGEVLVAKGKEGDNLLDIVTNNNLEIDGFGACEGTLACSTCHLILKQEDYDKIESPVADEELDMLDLATGLTDTLSDVQCISFAGCGFLGLYLIGAASCLEDQTSLLKQVPMCGASAGALLAACLVCEIPTSILKQSFWCTAIEAQQRIFGAFSPTFSIEDCIKRALDVLPTNAHNIANGRLFISLTRARDYKNCVISNWESKEELIQCLLCSCFIPGFSGTKLPSFRGEKYIDGGFTDNLPISKWPCLSISPFASNCHISPKDCIKKPYFVKQGNHMFAFTPENIVRLSRSLFVPTTEVLEALYIDGYRQAATYLKNFEQESISVKL